MERRDDIVDGGGIFLGGRMARQRIQRVTPTMCSRQPDQLSAVLNQIIDELNNIIEQ